MTLHQGLISTHNMLVLALLLGSRVPGMLRGQRVTRRTSVPEPRRSRRRRVSIDGHCSSTRRGPPTDLPFGCGDRVPDRVSKPSHYQPSLTPRSSGCGGRTAALVRSLITPSVGQEISVQ
uniref:Secreted protein n=1 Tax=Eutreptiella gymnastica TaxID=73025 RepID=A0A7S4CIE4_9EUGL